MEIYIHSPSTLYKREGCYKLTRHQETGELYWRFHYRYIEDLPILDLSGRKRVYEYGAKVENAVGREFRVEDLNF